MSTNSSIDSDLLDQLRAIVGPKAYLAEEQAMEPYLRDWLKLYKGECPLVLQPSRTVEVSKILALCSKAEIGVVPQGGNTSLLGGSVPDESGRQIVVSLERMNNIREVDEKNYTMVVEAGCVLERVQEAASDAELLFPLTLGAEGSCQIGGNLSTNAGGTAVLRYGNTRNLAIGLEVVLSDGRVWNGLRQLRKSNTGYDLCQLFIGAEGTLGIITAAVLKLFPKPKIYATALVSLSHIGQTTILLDSIRHHCGEVLTAFEYIHGSVLKLETDYLPNYEAPLTGCEHVVLIELSSNISDLNLPEVLERCLANAFESGHIEDAIVAASLKQRDDLWAVRSHALSEALYRAGPFITCDVSVPVSLVPEFITEASRAVSELCEGVRVVPYGHAGDGNIHFDMLGPIHIESQDFMNQLGSLTATVYSMAQRYKGSFSAEHGVGRLKLKEMCLYREEVELGLLRAVKKALDPKGLMNPGKVVL